MNAQSLKTICNRFPGAASHLFGHPSNILVYYIRGRKFAYFKTSEPEKWRFSIRVTPDRFVELTDVPGIKPARYLARFHWITIVNTQHLSNDYLNELIQWSYEKTLSSLSKAAKETLRNI